MQRSADKKEAVNYSDKENDVGNIPNYEKFIEKLSELFSEVQKTLKKGGYCIVNVMDIRKKSNFYPLHSDLATAMQKICLIKHLYTLYHVHDNLSKLQLYKILCF